MIDGKKVTAIILVAGNSTRYGQNRNKNFDKIEEKEVMVYSLEAFNKNGFIDNIIIGTKEEEIPTVKEIISREHMDKQVNIVIGGKSRQETVHNCIKQTDADIVVIHDGARAAIAQEYINSCVKNMDKFKGVTIGVRSKDTIKITDENNIVIDTTKRSNTWIVQTPQCFDRKILLEMHEKYKNEEVTDDCMLMEKGNYKVKILEGNYTNIKITTYEDMATIKEFLKK